MALPAEPILASALWKPSTTTSDPAQSITQRVTRLSTGCQAVDKALESGFDYGSICCISGEGDAGAREISQALLVSQLFSSPSAQATFIDIGSSLDVRKLHKALTARLQSQGREDSAREAAEMLDRVNIMKTFDFVGLTEAITEIRDHLDGREAMTEQNVSKSKVPRGTIGDSDDEADEGDLLDVEAPADLPAKAQPSKTKQSAHNHLLIIDSITSAFTPLLKSNYTRAQSLLASFMRSLSHLTKQHPLCIVLVNDTTAYANVKEEIPSIFASCNLQPALGKAFSYALDLHLLVHQMPRETGRREMVNVVEVMQDRCGERVGKWAAFTADEATGGGLVGISG